ncbi:zinc finger CCCH domain-containing protein 14-like [Anneissia japonica]|uniref:zinc finger CCCH domain-containing protein 14-like n=1 Tax=Anneissia japonica TaxID=1529436 RepID=UPI001425A0B3|nr:zinc finger CCCH domain-containing protein 14-like [Anneissia japonica]
MDIGNEISHKIRDAIKAKLVDLGAYVDEELPDYIMVMIANKKTTAQMKDDLQLFLGNNTEKFALWLDAVLHKLQSATVEASLVTPTLDKETIPAAQQAKKIRKGKDSKTGKSSKHSKARESEVEKFTEEVSSAALHEPEPLSIEEKPETPDDPSQAVITLTPETGDIFDEELNPETTEVKSAPEKQVTFSPVAPPPETQVSEVAPMQRSHNVRPVFSEKPHPYISEKVHPKVLEKPSTDMSEKPHPDVSEQRLPDVTEESQVLNNTGKSTVTHISTSPMSMIGECEVITRTVQTVPITYTATKKIQSRLGVRGHRSGMHQGSSESRKYMLGSVVGQVIDDEEENDSLPVTKQGLTSVVKPKRRPTLPPSKQANKSLLVRAMSDAQRSTITELEKQRSNAVKIVRPSVKGKTVSRNLISRAISDATVSQIQTRIQQNPHKRPDRDELLSRGLISRSKSSEKIQRNLDNNQYLCVLPTSHQDEEEVITDDQDDTVLTVRHVDVESDLEHVEAQEDKRIMKIVYADERVVKTTAKVSPVHKIKEPDVVPPKPVNNPKFIVTLSGAEALRSPQKRAPKRARVIAQRPLTRTIHKQEVTTSLPLYKATNKEALLMRLNEVEETFESPEDEEFALKTQVLKKVDVMGISPQVEAELSTATIPSQLTPKVDQVSFSLHDSEDEEDNVSPSKKQKLLERCMFWPACKNGDTCSYIHPTTKCVTFPNCKFGDKCLYIHPNCKFDAQCSRSDCPYTHATRKQIGTQPSQKVETPSKLAGHGQTVCKFHPLCKNPSCPFHHPKPCRFGAACTRPDCIFSHPKVVTGSALKWTKNVKKPSTLLSSIPQHISL